MSETRVVDRKFIALSKDVCYNQLNMVGSTQLQYVLVQFTVSRDCVVQLYPPASTYIKTSFERILMYEIVGGFIHEFFNYGESS
jgi:hypothetical protein